MEEFLDNFEWFPYLKNTDKVQPPEKEKAAPEKTPPPQPEPQEAK